MKNKQSISYRACLFDLQKLKTSGAEKKAPKDIAFAILEKLPSSEIIEKVCIYNIANCSNTCMARMTTITCFFTYCSRHFSVRWQDQDL